jgi:hypothetical protein
MASSAGSRGFAYFIAAVLGVFVGAAVTFVSEWIGSALESTFNITLRAWELMVFGLGLLNIVAGLVSGILGVVSKRPIRGLVIGALLHAIVFSGWIVTSDSLQAAPITVKEWVLGVGIVAGVLAGVTGGALGRRFARP